ncbi:unnamed protein product [Somion occarium]|uniref:DUF2423 domain-containing protein n=1 Tax=Somion occarium TaxID=3059160 RepID=A0ABP1D348_9APHY
MAKSTRSKVKRHFRAKKREEGVYAATEAARLNRLHQKLKMLTTRDKDGDVEVEDVSNFADEEGEPQNNPTQQVHAEGSGERAGLLTQPSRTIIQVDHSIHNSDAMDLDLGPSDSSKRISTHGPRDSRRESWRLAKGLPTKVIRGMNRQGGIAAKRKAGRSQRRR